MRKLFCLAVLLLVPLASYGQASGQGLWEKLLADVEVLKAAQAKMEARLLALEKPTPVPVPRPDPVPGPVPRPDPVPTPKPDPIPDPIPVPIPSDVKPWNLELLGGWRVKEDFARGSFGIDHGTNTLYMAGHGQRRETKRYTLGAYTAGNDLNVYRIISPTETIPKFWVESENGQGTYADNYYFSDGVLWVAPRTFYEMNPKNETTIFPLSISSASRTPVTQITVNGLRGTAFGGFVKQAGKFPMLGGGGYESGQGSAFGPTLGSFKEDYSTPGKFNGTSLIDYPWSGAGDFFKRAPRFPNYTPVTIGDTWVALHPRDINGDGKNEGCWASDIVKSGGIAHSTGIYYWACMGTGKIDYGYQSACLATSFQNVMYRYHPTTYKLLDFVEFPGGTVPNDPQAIIGSDISPDGKYLYLMQGNQWNGGMYKVDSVLRVYAIK